MNKIENNYIINKTKKSRKKPKKIRKKKIKVGAIESNTKKVSLHKSKKAKKKSGSKLKQTPSLYEVVRNSKFKKTNTIPRLVVKKKTPERLVLLKKVIEKERKEQEKAKTQVESQARINSLREFEALMRENNH